MSLPLAPTVLKQAPAEVFLQKMLKASETITATTTTKAATAATSTAEPPLLPATATESMVAGPTPPKVVKASRMVPLTTTNAVTAPSTAEPALIPAGKSTAKATEPSLATAEPSTIAAESTPTLAEPHCNHLILVHIVSYVVRIPALPICLPSPPCLLTPPTQPQAMFCYLHSSPTHVTLQAQFPTRPILMLDAAFNCCAGTKILCSSEDASLCCAPHCRGGGSVVPPV
ncbi:mucin-7-like [Schistocerca nitens]|uniref:mucin-7-like n=1 Tax=Schistocerca nitens TaxID=7011 RepID=UPI002117793F|nr:mucin-7-like [Schistocerca nitens]